MLTGSVAVHETEPGSVVVHVDFSLTGRPGVRRWELRDGAGVVIDARDVPGCPERVIEFFPLPRPRLPVTLVATDCAEAQSVFPATLAGPGGSGERRPCPPPDLTNQPGPPPDDSVCQAAVDAAADAGREADQLCERIQHLRRLIVWAAAGFVIACIGLFAILTAGAASGGGGGLLLIVWLVSVLAALAIMIYFQAMVSRYAEERNAVAATRRNSVERWRQARDVALETCCADVVVPELAACEGGE